MIPSVVLDSQRSPAHAALVLQLLTCLDALGDKKSGYFKKLLAKNNGYMSVMLTVPRV